MATTLWSYSRRVEVGLWRNPAGLTWEAVVTDENMQAVVWAVQKGQGHMGVTGVKKVILT